jgi:hypothetical protein
MLIRCNFLFFLLATGGQGGLMESRPPPRYMSFFQETLKLAGKYMEISTLEGINTQHYTL